MSKIYELVYNVGFVTLPKTNSPLESVKDFLIKLDIKSCMRRAFFYQIMSSSGLPKLWTTSSNILKFVLSKSFSVLKIGQNFPKKKSVKNLLVGDQLLLKSFLKILIFKVLYFLEFCPIFVGSVHTVAIR